MSQLIYCPNCGTAGDAKFCPNCGTNLDDARKKMAERNNLKPENSVSQPQLKQPVEKPQPVKTAAQTNADKIATNPQPVIPISPIEPYKQSVENESLEEYAAKLNKSNAKCRTIILASVSGIIVILAIIGVILHGWSPFSDGSSPLDYIDDSNGNTSYELGDIKFKTPDSCRFLGTPNDSEYGESLSFIFDEHSERSGSLQLTLMESYYGDLEERFYEDFYIEDEFKLLNNKAISFVRDDDSSSYKIGALFSYNDTAYTINISSFTDTNLDEKFKESAQYILNYIIDSIDELNESSDIDDEDDDDNDYDYEDNEDDDQSGRIHDEMVFEAYYTYLDANYDDYTEDGMDARVALYDIDDDGTNEMIISYGHGTYDWTNEIYAIDDDEEVCYLGEVPGNNVFYAAEDGDGLYAVYGLQGYQSIKQVTVDSSGDDIVLETIFDGGLEDNEDYYENDYPVDFVELDTYLGYD